MSLINDALRRTKQSQQRALPSAPPGPQLQPLEAVVLPPPNRRLMRLGVAGAAALVGLLLIWQATRSHQPGSADATMPAAPRASNSPSDVPRSAAPAPDLQPAVAAGESPPSPGHEAEPAAKAPSTNVLIFSGPASATNTLPAAPPEEPSPATPAIRLQAIVFHPTRPSAMINGKTLFVGDMLGEMRLVAISRESATLVGGGQTNLLTLR